MREVKRLSRLLNIFDQRLNMLLGALFNGFFLFDFIMLHLLERWKSRNRDEIMVSDRGDGIPEGAADKIFDPFYTSKISRSGVGLSISKRFIEAAEGQLTIRNRKGGGSEARITLPREGG